MWAFLYNRFIIQFLIFSHYYTKGKGPEYKWSIDDICELSVSLSFFLLLLIIAASGCQRKCNNWREILFNLLIAPNKALWYASRRVLCKNLLILNGDLGTLAMILCEEHNNTDGLELPCVASFILMTSCSYSFHWVQRPLCQPLSPPQMHLYYNLLTDGELHSLKWLSLWLKDFFFNK